MSAATANAALAATTKTTAHASRVSARPAPELDWDEIARRAPQMVATMQAYLDQLAVSSRPSTVAAASLALRQFAAHLTETDPGVQRRWRRSSVATSSPTSWPWPPGRANAATRRSAPRPSATTSGCCAPSSSGSSTGTTPTPHAGCPVFAGDLPKADEPTPKFLDDPTAAKFMAALAIDPNRRRRLIVELLARTGMRAGELGGLRDDAMYRLGDTYWLRIPLGKLHNDRTVPLHPMLVGLINDYRAWRGPTSTGLLVERDDHQPFDRRTIHRYVQAVARRAGVGHVHPHPLRHTLATQCINRGMSLEAIAALLGPPLTADDPRLRPHRRHHRRRAVLHRHPRRRSRHASGRAARPTMRDAAALHRRLLGNGHCTRPLELDCRFQTICEGCGFFQTGPEFVTILRRQRDDATAHTDLARTQLYDDLVRVIDERTTRREGLIGGNCHTHADSNRRLSWTSSSTAPARRSDGGLVGEDAHDVGAPLDLLVDPLERVRRPDLAPVGAGGRRRRRRCRPRRRASMRVDGGELAAELVGDRVELLGDRGGVGLGEDRADGGGDHLRLSPWGPWPARCAGSGPGSAARRRRASPCRSAPAGPRGRRR